jgi:hypothetical protein
MSALCVFKLFTLGDDFNEYALQFLLGGVLCFIVSAFAYSVAQDKKNGSTETADAMKLVGLFYLVFNFKVIVIFVIAAILATYGVMN